MSVFSIQLEACDPTRNRFRAYQVDVARDLFGAWLVEVKFGRIGAKGRMLRFTMDDEPAARRMVRERLQRRKRAPGRIGVAYRTLELWDPHGWMPAALPNAAQPTAAAKKVSVARHLPNSSSWEKSI
jgi:predicted DNA-binding WGR domain protein